LWNQCPIQEQTSRERKAAVGQDERPVKRRGVRITMISPRNNGRFKRQRLNTINPGPGWRSPQKPDRSYLLPLSFFSRGCTLVIAPIPSAPHLRTVPTANPSGPPESGQSPDGMTTLRAPSWELRCARPTAQIPIMCESQPPLSRPYAFS
jgi:hypothetical protein